MPMRNKISRNLKKVKNKKEIDADGLKFERVSAQIYQLLSPSSVVEVWPRSWSKGIKSLN
jgi:uncharacterized protein HemX